MKALRVPEPGQLILDDIPMQTAPVDDEVVIRICAAGICGSDIHILHGQNPFATFPRTLGHEVAGIVHSVGKDVQNLKEGDHVVVDNVISCGHCYACRVGRHNVCKNLKALGVHVDGGFMEYFKISSKNVYKISEEIPLTQAALAEPYAIAFQCADRGRLTRDDMVLICGAGPIGLLILEVCKLVGAKVAIMDTVDSRLEVAKSFGADLTLNPKSCDVKQEVMKFTDDEGCSLIFEATGNVHVFESCIRDYPSQAGRVVVVGFPNVPASIVPADIMKRELDILGTRVNNYKFPKVIECMEKGIIHPERVISHTLPIEQSKEAFELFEKCPQDVMKVVLTF